MKVDRQRIVAAALDLLDEAGIDGLTTRALARRLGVQQPALYWHFRSKRLLLDALNQEILARGHKVRLPGPGQDWREFLIANARSFRRALLSHRDGARVHAGTEADPGALPQVETQLAFLGQAGFTPELAMDLLVAIGRYVVGCVLEEQAEYPASSGRGPDLDAAAASHPLTAAAVGHYRRSGADGLFEAGLALMIAGAEARLRDRGAGPAGPACP
jgi:TetR/AcrR family tetracycline transcriptional repressor